ncbi:MAG: hypothetical protein QXQ64_02505 [Candidatus Bathyarchaeia archaeon]
MNVKVYSIFLVSLFIVFLGSYQYGFGTGYSFGYDIGYRKGYSIGYDEGYNESYSDGSILSYVIDQKILPYILISNRTVEIAFRLSNGSISAWTIGVDTFEAQIISGWYQRAYNLSYITLTSSKTGEKFRVIDFRPFVLKENFVKVMSNLYRSLGNDDVAFVREVWFIVTQLTAYSSENKETPRYPLETLVGGGGDCEDMAILIASMLKAAPVNYNVSLVYMDSSNPLNPVNINHVLVWVETPSGYKTFVDGTSKTTMSPFKEVSGWYLEV